MPVEMPGTIADWPSLKTCSARHSGPLRNVSTAIETPSGKRPPAPAACVAYSCPAGVLPRMKPPDGPFQDSLVPVHSQSRLAPGSCGSLMRISIALLAGLSWSAIYILLESAQSVFFGSVLQKMDSFQLGFWVFGITSFILLLGVWRFDPEQIRLCGRNLQGLFACNCSTAAGWILYLFSIQLIEPAVAFTLSSAAMPISAIGLAFLGIGEPVTLDTRQKRAGFVLVSAGIVFLVGTTLLGFSGFVRGSLATGLLGSASALLSGCAFAWMLIHCRALDARGIRPVPVFAFRFPLYIVLAAFGWLLGLDYKAPVETGDAAIAILIGLAIMAFPLYAMQKALSGISVLLLSTITALGPFIVFLMQMVEGRVAFSGFTLAGLLIYSSGVLLAMPGLIREGAREVPRPDTRQTLIEGKS